MPIYEYECPECAERFSRLRPMRELDEPSRCPRCGNTEARRVLSQFATTSDKGGGAGCAPSG
jgi:putative FmdB family regulatory protein